MPPGRSDSHSVTAKNSTVNASSAHGDVVSASAATPVSKATFAVRGMAYSAPMDRYTAMEKTRPNTLPARDAMSTMPLPDTATAITASAGRTTAVDRKPAIAGAYESPASTPSCGGKMRLPAPKNIAKSISATTTTDPNGIRPRAVAEPESGEGPGAPAVAGRPEPGCASESGDGVFTSPMQSVHPGRPAAGASRRAAIGHPRSARCPIVKIG